MLLLSLFFTVEVVRKTSDNGICAKEIVSENIFSYFYVVLGAFMQAPTLLCPDERALFDQSSMHKNG
jgi:hypothetical protein